MRSPRFADRTFAASLGVEDGRHQARRWPVDRGLMLHLISHDLLLAVSAQCDTRSIFALLCTASWLFDAIQPYAHRLLPKPLRAAGELRGEGADLPPNTVVGGNIKADHGLFLNIANRYLPGVLAALKQGAQINALYTNGRLYQTPLTASLKGSAVCSLPLVRGLLLARADPNGLDGCGLRPLHHCAHRVCPGEGHSNADERRAIALLLLRAGADPALPSMVRDRSSTDAFGVPRGPWVDDETPEQHAAGYLDQTIVALLRDAATVGRRIRPRPCLTYSVEDSRGISGSNR